MRILAMRHHEEVMDGLQSITNLLSRTHRSLAVISRPSLPVSSLPTSRPESMLSHSEARRVSVEVPRLGADVEKVSLPHPIPGPAIESLKESPLSESGVCIFFF